MPVHGRVDVARHGQVEQRAGPAPGVLGGRRGTGARGAVRAAVRAAGPGLPRRLGGQHQAGRAGTGDDDVGSGQLGPTASIGTARRPGAGRAEDLGQPLGPGAACGWRRRSRRPRPRASVAAASEDIEPAPIDQGALLPWPSADVGAGGELLQAEGDQRLPGPVDAGLAVRPLADPQRLLEQVVQQPARGVQLLARAPARP